MLGSLIPNDVKVSIKFAINFFIRNVAGVGEDLRKAISSSNSILNLDATVSSGKVIDGVACNSLSHFIFTNCFVHQCSDFDFHLFIHVAGDLCSHIIMALVNHLSKGIMTALQTRGMHCERRVFTLMLLVQDLY